MERFNTEDTTQPLGHVLRFLVSRFNDCAQRRRNNLGDGTQDKVLTTQIKQAFLYTSCIRLKGQTLLPGLVGGSRSCCPWPHREGNGKFVAVLPGERRR